MRRCRLVSQATQRRELCSIAFPQPHPGNVGFPQPHPGNVGVRKPRPLGHFSIELVVKVCHDVCGYLCRLLHPARTRAPASAVRVHNAAQQPNYRVSGRAPGMPATPHAAHRKRRASAREGVRLHVR